MKERSTNMSVIDLHCDTIWRLMDLGGKGDLLENDGAVSIRKMQAGEVAVQFFACFLYRDAMEGRTEEEKYENGYLIGKSSQYFEVCLKSNDKKLLNHIIKLKVNSCFGENLICELIK